MADPEEAFSTLDDFLLSLADGVAQAQAELARAGALGPPGRQFTYHLPRVDFELKMNLRVVEDESLSRRYRTVRLLRDGNKHLLFKPLSATETSSTLEIAAVVKGAFVAVPANGGLPSALLSVSVDASDPRAPVVRAVLTNAAGEPLPGVDVQFNLDREESAALTASAGRTLVLDPGTGFEQAVAATDETGQAQAVLRVPSSQGPGLLALVVDAAERTETVVYEVRA